MKKLLLLVLLLAGGYAAYHYGLLQPERRACRRMAELCGEQPGGVDKCVRDLEPLSRSSPEAVAKLEACVKGASGCAQGVGCLLTAGATAAGNMLGDMIKGIGDALRN
jgi:hypothetical protein